MVIKKLWPEIINLLVSLVDRPEGAHRVHGIWNDCRNHETSHAGAIPRLFSQR